MTSRTVADMKAAIRSTLGSGRYREAGGPEARIDLIVLSICSVLAERRSVYVPEPGTIRRQFDRELRDASIHSEAAAGKTTTEIARRHALSTRQVRRILSAGG